jgi:hypothetical protein
MQNQSPQEAFAGFKLLVVDAGNDSAGPHMVRAQSTGHVSSAAARSRGSFLVPA